MKSSENKNRIKTIAHNSRLIAYLKNCKPNNRSITMKRLYSSIKKVQLVINSDKILKQQNHIHFSNGLGKLNGI